MRHSFEVGKIHYEGHWKEWALEIETFLGPEMATRDLATLIKKKTTFSSYKDIQMGSGAKSYMRKGFLIYEEMHKYFHHL
jgi:hypothetical protein